MNSLSPRRICLGLLLVFCVASLPVDGATHGLTATIEALKNNWQGKTATQIRAAAIDGDASAQYVLALSLIYEPDAAAKQEGFKWASASADQNLAAAEGLVGWAYQYGLGVEKDKRLALDWTQRSAERGFTESEYQFGFFLTRQFNGNGTQQTDFTAVAKWYQRAAEKGHMKAQHALGDLYYYGKLGSEQRSNCVIWFQQAAQQGNAESKAKLAEALQRYPGAATGTTPDVVQLLRESAAAGNLAAQLKLALRYQTGAGVEKSDSEAFHWMEHAAKHDASKSSAAAEAKYRLGLMYESGIGVQRDLTNAYELFIAAGMQNHTANPDAQFRLAQMFERGEFLSQDDAQAVIFYFSSATQLGGGSNKQAATASLFRLLSQNRGVLKPEDVAENLKMSGMDFSPTNIVKTLHAQVSDPDAQFYLGEIYADGRAIPQDEIEATVWLLRAAAQNHSKAQERVEQMKKVLSPALFQQAKDKSAAKLRGR
jgi:TPR repeat protein